MMPAQAGAIREGEDLVEPEMLSGLVSYRIRLLQIAAYKAFEQKTDRHGAAPRYFGLLKLIAANPGVTQTRLAEAVFLDRSSLVPILETLTREGWVVRRKTVEDKRLRRIFLTAEGAVRLKALQADVCAHEAMMTAGMTAQDKARLLALLARVDSNLRAAHGGRT